MTAGGPRFERKQVVANLSKAFGALLQQYRLGLQEMMFEGNRHNEVIRDAVLEACRREGILLGENR